MVVLLSVVLALTVAGCGAVVWAARGGPRWVRAVATATLVAGELVRRSGSRSETRSNGGDE
ncbi:hypothetical protein ACFOZ0_26480 [Streptomyces yaanensis]|uniref:Uncharacterized protein n=1 Tax=Streptomyces yaanensis TaxID=1142239 RepID=A0ABV7SKW2_9ACTN|nr:hypothetical protein [Streptomyces sp. CGMCC 4.7035]WNC01720.1 hypothetical protein Q2K21_28685 [Streptomyces sp. CGMCC 4.7035]